MYCSAGNQQVQQDELERQRLQLLKQQLAASGMAPEPVLAPVSSLPAGAAVMPMPMTFTTPCTGDGSMAGVPSAQAAQSLLQHSLSGSLPSQAVAAATAAVCGPNVTPELPQVCTAHAHPSTQACMQVAHSHGWCSTWLVQQTAFWCSFRCSNTLNTSLYLNKTASTRHMLSYAHNVNMTSADVACVVLCCQAPSHLPSAVGVLVEEGPGSFLVKVSCKDRHGLLSDIANALCSLPLQVRWTNNTGITHSRQSCSHHFHHLGKGCEQIAKVQITMQLFTDVSDIAWPTMHQLKAVASFWQPLTIHRLA